MVVKIAYNGTCLEEADFQSLQCQTKQALCINNTCQCNDGVYYKESTDSCEIRPTLNTRPIVSAIGPKTFRIKWDDLKLNDTYQIFIKVYDMDLVMKTCTKDIDFEFCSVAGLETGTEYQIHYNITDIVRDVPSITYKIFVYTAPEAPPQPTTWERWEKNVTMTWENISHNCEYYILTIAPAPLVGSNSIRIPGNDKLHNVTFDHLSGGILYTVTIEAVAGENSAKTISSHYTRPVSVTNATILNQTNYSLDVSVVYNDDSSKPTSFIVYIDPLLTTEACDSCNNTIQQACNKTFYCGASSRFTINNLQDGTLYNLSIYAVLDGLTSEEEYFIQDYTRPNGPSVPAIGNITSTGFDVTYTNDSSNFDLFTIKVCFENQSFCQMNMSTKYTYFTATNLTAGTNYKVTVNTVLHNGLESLQPQSSSSFTRPNGPNSVNIPSGQIHENNVTIVYTTVNSFYDHIEVDLLSNDIEITVIKTYNTSILTGLRAATNYKINVCTATQTGLRSSDCLTETFTTRPSSPGSAEFLERGVDFITYDLSKNNGTFTNFDILDKDETLYQTLDSSSDRIFKAEGLVAGTLYEYKVYTNYSGLRSDSFLLIQTCTLPGEASGLTLISRTNTSMNGMWDAPDVGIVTSYQWIVTCLGPNSRSQLKTFNDTTSMTRVDINGLESGSVCKVTVTSQIIFNNDVITGNPIHKLDWCTTEQGPGKIESLSNTDATATSLTIEWEKPSVRNGVIQSYEIVVFLKNNEEKRTTLNCTKCTILPKDYDLHAIVQRCSNASVCDNAISESKFIYNITGLHTFRTYTVTVQAKTSIPGPEKTSFYTTEESVPEKIRNLQVTPESNVTKRRNIDVQWEILNEMERNGIIIHYFVQYTFEGNTMTESLNSNSSKYVIQDIKPGNYTIKVFASTSKGNGTYVSNNTTLGPGAPIKVPEKTGPPLIHKSSVTVADAETQIAIELPVESFLCNTTNGEPVEWGVIVSEESVATGEPFVGSKSEYEKRKTNLYFTWKSAKGKTPMPAYIATDPNKFDPCRHNEKRQRRSTTRTPLQTSFTIGEDEKCSSSPKTYCNGELPPHRSFRVKSYACTDGGCTETNYGPPLQTGSVSAYEMTIPIAVGVTLAIIVVLTITVVIVLRRKPIICFGKKDDSSSDDGYEDLAEIEHRTPKVPEYMTPGQINTANFPAAEEIMPGLPVRNFTEEFKLLQKRSPSHPITVAETSCNRAKNRQANILPFDHSRVKLNSLNGIEDSDYINANFIPGCTLKHEYIATQGPMMTTYDDFWRMISEQNVDTIVMLTKLMENGENMCNEYWPDVSDLLKFNNLIISVTSETRFPNYVERVIKVKKQDEEKTIHQFCYSKWSAMEFPETSTFLDFVKNVRNYKKPVRTGKISGPMVVHCSNGTGRTGTFIAVDTVLQYLRNNNDVDIFNIVLEMRNHRSNMVQTENKSSGILVFSEENLMF
ncbi:hypothetical protein ACF0H5_008196 [Mactra antiquata]